MVGAPQASGGYRDERDAALAQIESLRQQVAALEPEVQRLRAENETLRRELTRYSGQPYAPTRSTSPAVVIAIAVAAMMFLGGVVSFLAVRSEAPSSPQPVSVPVSAPVEVTPSSAPPIVPTQVAPSLPAPVSSTPMPSSHLGLTGT